MIPELSEDEIDEALTKVEAGLNSYCWIQDNLGRCDVSTDRGFQRRYTGFYRIRRDETWLNVYYEMMEEAKKRGISFPEALDRLQEQTGAIEASFASKLVATLDPNKPVIDKHVLENFGLRLPYHYVADRKTQTIHVYIKLCEEYERLMASPLGKRMCSKFAEKYPQAYVTDVKKIDLILWQKRR